MRKSSCPAYLTDDMWFVHSWNKNMQTLFDLPDELINQFGGSHELEFIFNPDFLIRKSVLPKYWSVFALGQLKHFIYDTGLIYRKNEIWLKEVIKELSKFKDFKKMWKEALSAKRDFLPREEHFFTLTLSDNKITFFVSVINLDRFPRFNLVELIPEAEKP